MSPEMTQKLILIFIVLLQILIIFCTFFLSSRLSGKYEKGSAGFVIKSCIWSIGSLLAIACGIVFMIRALSVGAASHEAYAEERREEIEAAEKASEEADREWEEAHSFEDATASAPEGTGFYSEDISEEGEEGYEDIHYSDDVTTDGMVAIYTTYFSSQDGYKYETDWSAKGDPGAVIYKDDEVVRYLRYDRLSKNEKCCLYVLYEDDRNESEDTRILDMYAYVIDTGEVIDSGRKAWTDTGTPEYREATGE